MSAGAQEGGDGSMAEELMETICYNGKLLYLDYGVHCMTAFIKMQRTIYYKGQIVIEHEIHLKYDLKWV